MRTPNRSTSLVAALLLMLPTVAFAQEGSPPPSPDATGSPVLFVVSGGSGSIDGDVLTLEQVDSVIWFTDRPSRDAGHISVEAFIDAWGDGADSFADDPPNAELSTLSEAGADAVLLLLSVSGDASTLTFQTQVLDGTMPEGDLGPSALFIDAAIMTLCC